LGSWVTIPALASPGSEPVGGVAGGDGPTTASTAAAAQRSATSASGTAVTAGVERLAKDVLPGLNLLAPASPAPSGQVLQVGVGLALPNPSALQAYYQSEHNPSSPDYRHFLTPEDFAARFGVPAATYQRVVSWVRSGGLQITQTNPAGDWVAATGTVSQLQKLFQTTIQSFIVKGVPFLANTTAPVVPAGDSIVSVVGLNTLQKFSTPTRPANAAKPAQSPTVPGCLPSCTYGPQDLWSLYHMPSSNLGQGQPMAIFGEGRTDDVIANLRGFERQYKLPAVPVSVKKVGPGTFADDSGQTEWDLDSQASTGMAPDASGLQLYFSDSLFDASVESLFTAWVSDPSGPRQANASFGECETNPTNPVTGPLAQQSQFGLELGDDLEPVAEQTLLQAATEGRTLFTSAGDTGSSCPVIVLPVAGAGNGVVNQVVPIQNYPCVSQYAVCVGGTVLWSDGNTPPQRAIERGWEFTGGGAAPFQAEPAFQKPVGAVNIPCLVDQDGNPFAPGTICRGVPDVAAMSGDVIDNGYNIVANGTLQAGGGAGTSLSSPLWVGMWTRIQAAAPPLFTAAAAGTRGSSSRHAAATVSYPGLGFAAYPIYRAAESPAYSNDFFDVTLGVNGLYHAATGWDYVSGWGVPDVTNLMQTLDGTTTPANGIVPPPLTPPTPPGGCNALWINPAHTATDTFGGSDPQLTLLEGNMAPSADHRSLVVKLTVQNLSQTVPTGATGEDWYMTWTYRGTDYFAQAQLGALPGSTPTFADGTVVAVGASHQFQAANNDTGSFTAGKDGTIEIVVPLANVGAPPPGAVLSQPAGESDIEIGVPPNPLGLGVASLQPVDTGGPANDYVVGTISGTSGCTLPG
ncbi:MAG TPA: protease pro-enzyme activation domain-containing protein, partial [Acidimicrobiales bacterium]|nr:protease pro-enzyme activation domain-containing protein [Acidimicrobiales bacterium]